MKAKKIALSLAIMAFAFSPLANATTTHNLGTLSGIPSNTYISSADSDTKYIFTSPSLASTLSGTSTYSFTFETILNLNGQIISDTTVGYELSSVEVFKGSTLIDTVTATKTLIGPNSYDYSAIVGDVKLEPSTTYTVEIFGTSFANFPFQGNIAINAAAVPEAEEWAMLLLGLPLIAWASGRKYAVKSSVVAA